MPQTATGSAIPVALACCENYQVQGLEETVGSLLETIGCRPGRNTRILVKPNLLAATPPDFLPCTHPQVVRAACQYLLDFDAKVQVSEPPQGHFGQERAGLKDNLMAGHRNLIFL